MVKLSGASAKKSLFQCHRVCVRESASCSLAQKPLTCVSSVGSGAMNQSEEEGSADTSELRQLWNILRRAFHCLFLQLKSDQKAKLDRSWYFWGNKVAAALLSTHNRKHVIVCRRLSCFLFLSHVTHTSRHWASSAQWRPAPCRLAPVGASRRGPARDFECGRTD